jgi:hypothetical protein
MMGATLVYTAGIKLTQRGEEYAHESDQKGLIPGAVRHARERLEMDGQLVLRLSRILTQ